MPTRTVKGIESVSNGLPSEWKQQLRRRLLNWYSRHARDLPWRRSRDPYHIWVSEIMLQQTQVATVEPYFERFLATFPSVSTLAAADEQEVLRHWEGLGYYRRARQMHRAARLIVQQHGGQFPRDPQAVRDLPGIGRYTAGAVLSIAFDAREPILEANSARLVTRLIAFSGDPTKAKSQRLLWDTVSDLLPRRNVGCFNQALMELGSRICTPRAPACLECPLTKLCAARARNLQDALPRPKPKPQFEKTREAAVVVFRRSKILILQCGDGERWEGLWDFPRFPLNARQGRALERELIANVKKLTGAIIKPAGHLITIRHGVTRFRITLECYSAIDCSGRTKPIRSLKLLKWVEPAELDRFPLNTTGRKIGQLLQKRGGVPVGATP